MTREIYFRDGDIMTLSSERILRKSVTRTPTLKGPGLRKEKLNHEPLTRPPKEKRKKTKITNIRNATVAMYHYRL